MKINAGHTNKLLKSTLAKVLERIKATVVNRGKKTHYRRNVNMETEAREEKKETSRRIKLQKRDKLTSL